MDGAGHAVGAGHRDALHHIGAVLLDQAPGRVLHHAVKDLLGLLAGQHLHHLVVHPQQQGDHLTHAPAVEGGDLGGGRRSAQGVFGACHRDGGGSAGRGGHRRDPARGLAGVDPQGPGVLAVIIDVVGLRPAMATAVSLR